VRLKDKVAIITGGGSGIGQACGELFAEEGASVVLAGRRAEKTAEAAAAITARGGRALGVACDVARATDVARVIRRTMAEFGAIHILVNSAGVLLVGTAEQTSEGEWDHVINTNLKGVFLVSRAAIPELRRAGGGSIVNISSVLGLVGMKNGAAYCASKGGVTLLTKAMALDHAADGIRVNCICPAIVETELLDELWAKTPDPEASRRRRAEQIPLGRFGTPRDVARMALFLASDESSWVTGAALPLDGGFTAY
jgi:NAD(P)-dependent dehydrogenase (short-subunit alcohol dehydrogenase family)